MILMFIGCFSIVSEDFDSWKNTQSAEETGFEIQDFEIDVSEIPSGTFQMGCTEGDSQCYEPEYPVHTVEITRAFMMMKTEVTQGLYEAVMGNNPSSFSFGSDFPVEQVSWFDAVRFANELSRLEGREECYSILEGDSGTEVDWIGFDCKGWRLPTETEWEYAARGNENFIYAGSNNSVEVAWYNDNDTFDIGSTQKVAQKQSNGFGLYDMSGNVFEWVWDWEGDYSTESQLDPTGALTGSVRVNRGGGWQSVTTFQRVSHRYGDPPMSLFADLGFRLGRTL